MGFEFIAPYPPSNTAVKQVLYLYCAAMGLAQPLGTAQNEIEAVKGSKLGSKGSFVGSNSTAFFYKLLHPVCAFSFHLLGYVRVRGERERSAVVA